ncbi:MAG: hypothetical protein GF388_10030, partial [Candidatus Aegiribacteria sp.]|nr:hypothetical protein [Candidatus Aegiribacteria sp.]MBD3295370.1 hypothetical protein [Candidatus Fermentibacteria bacterium]
MNKLLVILVIVLATGSVSAQTNPFLSGSPDSGGNEPASVSSGSWVTSLPLMDRIVSAQRSLQGKLSELIRRISEEGDAGALFILLGLSFLYGVLHALGPGHRKTVLAG